MTERLNYQISKKRRATKFRRSSGETVQPFLPPAAVFYLLATVIALVTFFLTLLVLSDSEEDILWIPAGVIAGLILVGAVIIREIILRNRRNNLLLAQERLDFNLKKASRQNPAPVDENKLTLEKNLAILNQISQKSEAARVLGKLGEAHWEVFELCDEYLHRSERELETVRTGSPRLAALNRGREQVRAFHKYHLLAFSEVESRSLIQEAKASATINGKLEIAARALNILDSALEFYPNEQQLIESANAVKEFIVSIKVSHWVEQAEKAAFKGNRKRAINHYRDALFFLARENIRNNERDLIAERINREIEKLRNS